MRVQRIYGITPKEYAALKKYQGNKCAICDRPKPQKREQDVDHDHSCCNGVRGCGKCTRGILCGKCNRFLAWIEENMDSASRLAEYLQDPPMKRMREGR